MKSPPLVLTRRAVVLAGLLLGLLALWGLFHRQINDSLRIRRLLNSASPTEEAFLDLARQEEDPVGFLQRCWATGRIPHRQLVAAFLNAHALPNPAWLAQAEPLMLAAAVDADESVRELGLAMLATQRNPHLFECARAQLQEVDPILRLLGLQYLRKTEPKRAVPVLISLLDDPDLRVMAEAEVTLARWSGQDYGVRARLAIPTGEGERAGAVDAANAQTIRRGVEQRKQWWKLHASEYPAPNPEASGEPLITQDERPPAPDFELKDLNGRKMRLSSLRGKVIFLNFWATWCSACLTEIPDLVELRNKLGGQVAIVGVALDGVPDQEGEQEQGESGKNYKSLKSIHTKIERAVKARKINYPVLLDPTGVAGGQFNGGELPTTVILDANGRVRRRFVGARSLGVFAAMAAEAQRTETHAAARPGSFADQSAMPAGTPVLTADPPAHGLVPASGSRRKT